MLAGRTRDTERRAVVGDRLEQARRAEVEQHEAAPRPLIARVHEQLAVAADHLRATEVADPAEARIAPRRRAAAHVGKRGALEQTVEVAPCMGASPTTTEPSALAQQRAVTARITARESPTVRSHRGRGSRAAPSLASRARARPASTIAPNGPRSGVPQPSRDDRAVERRARLRGASVATRAYPGTFASAAARGSSARSTASAGTMLRLMTKQLAAAGPPRGDLTHDRVPLVGRRARDIVGRRQLHRAVRAGSRSRCARSVSRVAVERRRRHHDEWTAKSGDCRTRKSRIGKSLSMCGNIRPLAQRPSGSQRRETSRPMTSCSRSAGSPGRASEGKRPTSPIR